MPRSTRVGVGYNIQIAVDTKHKLIAEQQVHNKVSDLGLLAETAEAARKNLDVTNLSVVADRGYFKIEDIEDCETYGIVPYVPKPIRSPAAADILQRNNSYMMSWQIHIHARLGKPCLLAM